MKQEQVQDWVADVLASLTGLAPDEVTPETTIESLALDSLDVVELVLRLQRELGVAIEPDSLNEIVTVQDVADVIEAAGPLAA